MGIGIVGGCPGVMAVGSQECCWRSGAVDKDGTAEGDTVDVDETFVEGPVEFLIEEVQENSI